MGANIGSPFITCNCGQSYASLSQLEQHMREVHPENTNMVSQSVVESIYFDANIFAAVQFMQQTISHFQQTSKTHVKPR